MAFAYVSGSALLEAILGDSASFQADDVDIYIDTTHELYSVENLKKYLSTKFEKNVVKQEIEHVVQEIEGDRSYYKTYYPESIDRVSTLTVAGDKIQLIYITKPIKQFVNENFDLSMLKNFKNELTGELTKLRPLDIHRRIARVEGNFDLERAKKYIDRGFLIMFGDHAVNMKLLEMFEKSEIWNAMPSFSPFDVNEYAAHYKKFINVIAQL